MVLKSLISTKDKLYNSLSCKKITDEGYEHVHKVYNKFKMKTMKDYRNLYLKYDVLLLVDVFEIFKNNC